MYYLLIAVSTIMFGLQFFFNKIYQKSEGSSLEKALVFAAGSSVVTALIMIVSGGFKIGFSWFSLAVATVGAVNGILFSYCSVVSMSKVNLSLYSLFTMLGGMLLPFTAGILIWGETGGLISKALCTVVIIIALCIGADFRADKTTVLFCMCVFILNGMSGVISKWHQSYPDINVSSSSFMLIKAIVTIVICGSILLTRKKESVKIQDVKSSSLAMAGFGIMSGLGNFLLLVALSHVDASVQYPMVTGGTIVVSTVISLFTKEKITAKNIIATVLALVATLLLV